MIKISLKLFLVILLTLLFSCSGENTLTQERPTQHKENVSWTLSASKACSMTINETQVRHFFDQSKTIPSGDWHYHMVSSPCTFRGKISINNKDWSYLIYPTGYGLLTPEDNIGDSIKYTCYSCDLFKSENITGEETTP